MIKIHETNTTGKKRKLKIYILFHLKIKSLLKTILSGDSCFS